MASQRRKDQEDALLGREEDVLKGEVLQEPLESLRIQVLVSLRKQHLSWYQSAGGRIYSAAP
jgi:hypothetical protein